MMAQKINLLAWFFICHIGNIADALLTVHAINQGVEELNPLMAYLIDISPALFVVTKITLFALAIDILSRRRPSWLRWVGLLYIAVLGWHLSFILFI
jgi:protein-S-isoprenylcysteine O-methyltransferase Ste14